MKNIAIILAGGSGQRLDNSYPKQFYKIAGKKVIEHTLDVFEKNPQIDEIAVVSNPSYVREIENIVLNNNYTKLKKILKGGKERYLSSLSAINAYDTGEEVNLIFHDAVRPLVNDRIISDCIKALSTYNAVDVAVKTSDTIIQVDEDELIESIPDRNWLRNGQTPQAFKISTIKEAYQIALQDPNLKTTDDCGVVRKYLPEEKIYVVKGEQFNMKLTYKEDIFLLEKLFQLKTTDQQTDSVTPFTKEQIQGKVIVVFGGSSGIGADIVKTSKKLGAHIYSFSRSSEQVDVTDVSAVQKALKEVHEKEGRIDAVINTAGVLEKEPFSSMEYDKIIRSIQINYFGAIIVAKEAYPYLKESKGSLLLYTSSSYTRGRAFYSLYSSSKAAIVNLVQALSEEWGDHVHINCINPERTNTPMRTKNFGIEPEGSLLKSETVAAVSLNTLFLPMTGEVIDVKKK